MNPLTSPLLTDLYQLTMLQAYFDRKMNDVAVFELFVRKLPPNRNFLVAAGLEQVLDFLEALQFTEEELGWLQKTGRFTREFLRSLESLSFTGDVYAMPEGTVFFSDEPILRVVAPMREAQLAESRLMNIVHFQTLIASKAVRTVIVAPNKLLVDFGLRRAHGAEAGLFAARAAYLAGFSGSATVLAGMLYGIPLFGTMAHSFVQAHESEEEAFEHFARSQAKNNTLLIDTYDTEVAAAKLIPLSQKLAKDGIAISGVRLDSGDLAEHARQVRKILDAGGLASTCIFASGNLDEYKIQDIMAENAPIDGFGVGTSMDTSSDRPFMDCAYKLQEYSGRATRKRSEGKATWPGRKQVFRFYDENQKINHDTVTLESAPPPQEGQPLVRLVMQAGRRLSDLPTLEESRKYASQQVERLPAKLHSLEEGNSLPVAISEELRALRDRVDVGLAQDQKAAPMP